MYTVNNNEFKELLLQKGYDLYREMPWRQDTRPYYVLSSELMLQQTQVTRVIPKFTEFIEKFPDEKTLASASLADVLRKWQGLGYNRRAKFLHEAAKSIVARGSFPDTLNDLVELSGVGKNTAGAILAYSFNKPSIFIETNIRTVYIHHFFTDNFEVDDKEIIERLEATIDQENPRQFYQALMDYGSWLKAQGVRNNSISKQYKKQAPLAGSVRQVRGIIVRELAKNELTVEGLRELVSDDVRFDSALGSLIKENMVTENAGKVHLTK